MIKFIAKLFKKKTENVEEFNPYSMNTSGLSLKDFTHIPGKRLPKNFSISISHHADQRVKQYMAKDIMRATRVKNDKDKYTVILRGRIFDYPINIQSGVIKTVLPKDKTFFSNLK